MSFGELEHLVLLEILRLGENAFALEIREGLRVECGRDVTRGALYRSLDRLAEKGLLRWTNVEPGPEHGGHARRRFTVTDVGLESLRARRRTLLTLWKGVEVLER